MDLDLPSEDRFLSVIMPKLTISGLWKCVLIDLIISVALCGSSLAIDLPKKEKLATFFLRADPLELTLSGKIVEYNNTVFLNFNIVHSIFENFKNCLGV